MTDEHTFDENGVQSGVPGRARFLDQGKFIVESPGTIVEDGGELTFCYDAECILPNGHEGDHVYPER